MTHRVRTLAWLTLITVSLAPSCSQAEKPQQNTLPAMLPFTENSLLQAGWGAVERSASAALNAPMQEGLPHTSIPFRAESGNGQAAETEKQRTKTAHPAESSQHTAAQADAQRAAEAEFSQAREERLLRQYPMDEDFLRTFKQHKEVTYSESGFWYHIDYEGDSVISPGAIVDVVVKETLTDGTVIHDMEISGTTLSQKVADFPPLFKEAILLLKNHGSMTMVVPPALAYGERGYLQRVPPDATMVYQLRIAEMYPENAQTGENPPGDGMNPRPDDMRQAGFSADNAE